MLSGKNPGPHQGLPVKAKAEQVFRELVVGRCLRWRPPKPPVSRARGAHPPLSEVLAGPTTRWRRSQLPSVPCRRCGKGGLVLFLGRACEGKRYCIVNAAAPAAAAAAVLLEIDGNLKLVREKLHGLHKRHALQLRHKAKDVAPGTTSKTVVQVSLVVNGLVLEDHGEVWYMIIWETLMERVKSRILTMDGRLSSWKGQQAVMVPPERWTSPCFSATSLRRAASFTDWMVSGESRPAASFPSFLLT